MQRALLLLLSICLTAGCSSNRERRQPSPVSTLAVAPTTRGDRALARAQAIARSGAPSQTPELDALAMQIRGTTPDLRLESLFENPGELPPRVRLRPGDTVEVTVYGQPEFSGERRIGMDGRVHLFLLGALELGGKTHSEATDLVQAKLEASYVKPAQVLVWIKEAAKTSIEVIGRVREPGTKDLSAHRRLSLHSALTLADGLLEDANGSQLTLIRADARGRQRCYHFSYEELVAGHLLGRQVWLEPDDQIVVPRLAEIYVVGEVEDEGAYPLRAGSTVASLLTLAGGPSENADAQRIHLIGREGMRPVTELDTTVQAGQVIFVPQRQRIYLVGEGVAKNGPLDLPAAGLSVVQAVAEAGWFTKHADLDNIEILRFLKGEQVRIHVPMWKILDGEVDEPRFSLQPGDLVIIPESIF